jgi:SRSO17 transposase
MCQEAKVPKERRTFRKKAELALEMVASARQHGLSFNCIGADGFYGNDPEFLRQMDLKTYTWRILLMVCFILKSDLNQRILYFY